MRYELLGFLILFVVILDYLHYDRFIDDWTFIQEIRCELDIWKFEQIFMAIINS